MGTVAAPPNRVEPAPTGWAALARHVAVIGLAGVATGVLVGGIGSRLFMRIAGATGSSAAQGATSEAGFTVGKITFGGTVSLILFVGIIFGILGAALYVVFRPWLAWAGRLRGVVFGVVLFAVGSASSDVMNPDNFDFFILGNGLLDVLLIAALFLAFGIVMEEIHRALDKRVSGQPGHRRIVFAAISLLGFLIAVPLMVSTMFGNSFCHCDPPVLVGWLTALSAVGTTLWWLESSYQSAALPARLAGYLGLLGATSFGLIRALSDAIDIIS